MNARAASKMEVIGAQKDKTLPVVPAALGLTMLNAADKVLCLAVTPTRSKSSSICFVQTRWGVNSHETCLPIPNQAATPSTRR